MVKRGGKDIVTVEIHKEIYEILKQMSKLKRYTVKEYINELLEKDAERDKVLLKYIPKLSIAVLDKKNNTVIINDKTAEDEIVYLWLREGGFFCDECEANECEHIMFALLQPEAKEFLVHAKK